MTAKTFSRRRFVGGMTVALGYAGLQSNRPLWAQSVEPVVVTAAGGGRAPADEYDSLVKICFNENPYGPSEAVLKAMTGAFKYANRYGYPDGGIVQAIAALHGVQPGNIVMGAGSTEILDIAGSAFLQGGKKVIGVEPTFGTVYEHATGLKAHAVRLQLDGDHRQPIPAMIQAAKENAADLGFVYVCNPNNPTGAIVTKQEIQQLLDGLPPEVPVLIDEAYHHFVESPDYATSIPYVIAGRPVIVARTFSKIAALAGMRLGYCVAPENLVERMRPYADNMGINALAKWGGSAALKDTEGQAQVKKAILETRKKTTGELESMGFKVIPSEANFFMVNLRRQVMPVIRAFRERGILVGRPFPPMLEFLRVSVGTPAEMSRFMEAFKDIVH
jgi:histidinol-phosphate aminotransferase